MTQGHILYASPRYDEWASTPYSNAIASLICLENPNYPNSPCLLLILPCPFYQRLFEHAWDCKIVFCKHVYHSWCAITHFSSSTKCLFEDCEEKMHLDQWVLLGVKKPFVVEKGILGARQIATTLVFDDFKGEFIKKFPKLNHSA